MIETYNLTKKFGNVTAVGGLSLEVEAGDCYGFIGPNGAGKTTTLRMLATLLKPTHGDAKICGHSILGNPREIRRNIGYMPDFFGVYNDLTAREYLEFFAAAYHIRGAEARKIVNDVLELTELTGRADTLVENLSRGVKQRLGLARVLVHDPKVLLLDEPASGLDPRARVEIRELLRELCKMGRTILLSSHILSELSELCNKIGIIEKGQLVVSGAVDEVMKQVKKGVVIRVQVENDMDQAEIVLSRMANVSNIIHENHSLLVTLSGAEATAHEIAKVLIDNDFRLRGISEIEPKLEDAFMQLTEGIVS